MSRNKKIIIIAMITAVVVIFARAPWLDNQSLHDKVFEERAEIDGTIDKHTGELICDYNVMWAPFGRWVASCEGGYYVTFWGKILYPKSVAAENPCAVCINGCDTCLSHFSLKSPELPLKISVQERDTSNSKGAKLI